MWLNLQFINFLHRKPIILIGIHAIKSFGPSTDFEKSIKRIHRAEQQRVTWFECNFCVSWASSIANNWQQTIFA